MLLKDKELIDKAAVTGELSNEEIKTLLKTKGDESSYLFQKADRVREKYHGKEVHLRGIIEFSNYCRRNCMYCGLRVENKKIKRYQMKEDDIIRMAFRAIGMGYKTIVFQSGEDCYDAQKIARIIKEIKAEKDVAITLSLGERDYGEYELWKRAGADRYLLKHEVADEKLYRKLHPGMSLEERIKRLRWLKELGYQVGSGIIVGLPGQNEETLAADIRLFKELDLDMVGIGPLIPHPETPLGKNKPGSLEMTLKAIALTRLMLPLAHIPATTALGTLDPEGRKKALLAGANVVMPNVTEKKYRSLYEIYPGKNCPDGEPAGQKSRKRIENIIRSLGRYISNSRGDSLRQAENR